MTWTNLLIYTIGVILLLGLADADDSKYKPVSLTPGEWIVIILIWPLAGFYVIGRYLGMRVKNGIRW